MPANDSLQTIFEHKAQIGAAYIWINPTIDEDDLVALTLDNEGYPEIPFGQPVPQDGEPTYLGYVTDGVSINFNLNYEDQKVATTPSFSGTRIIEERCDITGRLLWNGSAEIRQYFDLPGLNGVTSSYGGGAVEPQYYSLFIATTNQLKPGYVECWLFFSGYFQTASYIIGGLNRHEPLAFTYHAQSGADPEDTDCLRPAGQRMYHRWFQNIYTGEYIDPDTL